MTPSTGRTIGIALAAALAVTTIATTLRDGRPTTAVEAASPVVVRPDAVAAGDPREAGSAARPADGWGTGAVLALDAARPATPAAVALAETVPLPATTDVPAASPVVDPSVVESPVVDPSSPTPDEPATETTAPLDAPAAALERSATTGVPAGTVLTPMTGGTVTTSGTIANRVITGDVVFTGSNLTVRNVRVTGHAVFRGDDVVIEDSEFGSWALSGTERVRAARIDVFGNPANDGLHVTADAGPVRDVVVTDSWIHNPLIANGSHYDGIQVRGVDGLTIRNVLIDLGGYATGQNAALFLENANGGNRNVVVQGSWLLGGGYTIASYATDVRITDTVVRAGRWGYLNPTSWPLAAFTGNTTDGAAGLNGLGYDGTVVTVTGPSIVECWPLPDAAALLGSSPPALAEAPVDGAAPDGA